MKYDIAVIISFYDEHDIVQFSIDAIRRVYGNRAFIELVHSENGLGNLSLNSYDVYIGLTDLSKELDKGAYPAYASTRNVSRGFSELYSRNIETDLYVILAGDTLITDPKTFDRQLKRMKLENLCALVCQPINAPIHAQDPLTGARIVEGRKITMDMPDFSWPCFFVEGGFANKTQVFKVIPVVNDFASEQCFGEELQRAVESIGRDFRKSVGLLNATNPGDTYSFNDGIRFHSKSEKPGR